MMKKRIFSLLLVAAMLMSVLPVIANAEEAANPSISAVSLTLNSILSVNIKVDPGTKKLTGHKVRVTIGEDEQYQEVTGYGTEGNLAVFAARLPVHRLSEQLKIQLLDANNESLEEKTLSGADYCDAVAEQNPDWKDLADALKVYGASAAYFKNGGDTAPNVGEVSKDDVAGYAPVTVLASTDDALEPKVSLYLDDACNIRVKFNKAAWDEGGYTLYIGENAVAVEDIENGAQVVHQISAIKPQEWDTMHNIRVQKGDEVIYARNYCALSYVYQALNAAPGVEAKLEGLVKSMYLYYNAVNYMASAKFDYSVTYNANYGDTPATAEDSENGQSIETSKTFTVDANPFAAPLGYKFVGWESRAEGIVDKLNEKFDGGAVPAGWAGYANKVLATGDWTVTNGAVSYTGSNTSNNTILLSDAVIDAENYEFSVDVALPAVVDSTGGGLCVGLVFASNNDATNFHYIRTNLNQANSQTTATMGKSTTGTTFSPFSDITKNLYDTYNGETVTLKVVVTGLQIQLFIGDAADPILNYTADEGTDLSGKVGVMVRGSAVPNSFDNICVKAPGTIVENHAAGDELTLTKDSASAVLYAQWEEITLVNESFSGSTLPSGWAGHENAVENTAAWMVSNGVAAYSGSDTTNNKTLISGEAVGAENYILTAKVRIPASADGGAGGRHVGLVFGSNDAGTTFHYVSIMYNGSNYTAYIGYSSTGANTSSLTSAAVSGSVINEYVGQMVTLKVVVEGTNISLYIEGKDDALLSVTTTKAATLAGKVGFFMRGNVAVTAFDDIKVTAPNAVMYETFDGMSSVPGTWTQLQTTDRNGSWSTTGGVLQYVIGSEEPDGHNAIILDTPIDLVNYQITARVLMIPKESGKNIGFAFAGNEDNTSFQAFRFWNSGSYLYATPGTLGSTGAFGGGSGNNGVSESLFGTVVTVQIKVIGNTYTVYVNGTEAFSKTVDSAENLSGSFGFFVRGTVSNSFDNILVEKLEVSAE